MKPIGPKKLDVEKLTPEELEQIHNEVALHQEKIGKWGNFLPEFVYGGMDGCVTTFAVVAGAAGANLDPAVVLILGFANILADGLSMSIGNYLSTKSEFENYAKNRKIEQWEVEHLPEFEREEIRQIYRRKGFKGELLEKIVDVITADKERWVDEMMREELEMLPPSRSPVSTALSTFFSFIAVGLIPLLVYVFSYFIEIPYSWLFPISSVLTAFAFVSIGFLKAYLTHSPKLRSISETLGLGAIAATAAYFVGAFLEKILL